MQTFGDGATRLDGVLFEQLADELLAGEPIDVTLLDADTT